MDPGTLLAVARRTIKPGSVRQVFFFVLSVRWEPRVCALKAFARFLCHVCESRCEPCQDCEDGCTEEDEPPPPAAFTCLRDGCSLRSLCGNHAGVHQRRGHDVTVLASADHAGGPGADTLLGITHCRDHVGADGALTLVCSTCSDKLLCSKCAESHLVDRHALLPLAAVTEQIRNTRPERTEALQYGQTVCESVARQAREALCVLDIRRGEALAQLTAQFERLQAALRAQFEQVHRDTQIAFDSKARALTETYLGARALAGGHATSTSVLNEAASDLELVHASYTASACSRRLQQWAPHVPAEATVLKFEAGPVHRQGADPMKDALGRLVVSDSVSDTPLPKVRDRHEHTCSPPPPPLFPLCVFVFLCAGCSCSVGVGGGNVRRPEPSGRRGAGTMPQGAGNVRSPTQQVYGTRGSWGPCCACAMAYPSVPPIAVGGVGTPRVEPERDRLEEDSVVRFLPFDRREP